MEIDTLLKMFIVVIGLAVVAQAAMLVGIYLSVGRLSREVEGARVDFKKKIDPVAENLTEILENSRATFDKIGSNLVDVMQLTRNRAGRIDEVVGEVADRARLQALRFDRLIQDTVEKVEQTTSVVQKNILAPIQEASAVIRGVRSGLEFLFTRRTPSRPPEPTGEEQLFI
jgi:hypothetical protein